MKTYTKPKFSVSGELKIMRSSFLLFISLPLWLSGTSPPNYAESLFLLSCMDPACWVLFGVVIVVVALQMH